MKEKDIKAKEERDKKLKEEEKHRAEELYVVLKKTDENKMKMAETDRANIEEFWKVQCKYLTILFFLLGFNARFLGLVSNWHLLTAF